MCVEHDFKGIVIGEEWESLGHVDSIVRWMEIFLWLRYYNVFKKYQCFLFWMHVEVFFLEESRLGKNGRVLGCLDFNNFCIIRIVSCDKDISITYIILEKIANIVIHGNFLGTCFLNLDACRSLIFLKQSACFSS